MSSNDRDYKVSCWVKYLEHIGCSFKRIKSSHHIWKCPNCWRSVTFRGSEKEIPAFHIRTNMKTLNRPFEDFVEWVHINC